MGHDKLRTTDFDRVLRRHCRYVAPDDPIPPGASLVGLGVDSMGTLELFESTFSVLVPDESLTPETFSTPEHLWRVISALCPPA